MASEGYHEPFELLSARTKDMHRAITSLMEELEAVDWYQQRVDVVGDEELKAILAHNRDEEKEHAAMVLEWIRRRDDVLNDNLQQYLNTRGSILEIEESGGEGGGKEKSSSSGRRGGKYDPSGKTPTVGSLKGHGR